MIHGDDRIVGPKGGIFPREPNTQSERLLFKNFSTYIVDVKDAL